MTSSTVDVRRERGRGKKRDGGRGGEQRDVDLVEFKKSVRLTHWSRVAPGTGDRIRVFSESDPVD